MAVLILENPRETGPAIPYERTDPDPENYIGKEGVLKRLIGALVLVL
jgi:hypothetical protein